MRKTGQDRLCKGDWGFSFHFYITNTLFLFMPLILFFTKEENEEARFSKNLDHDGDSKDGGFIMNALFAASVCFL